MLQQWVAVNGARIAVRTAGDGEPLLVLHGMLDGGAWHAYQDRLAVNRTVIAPDHPGFGDSERPSWLAGMPDMIHGYLELLDTLGVSQSIDAVATCLGGWIAAELAAVRPGLFRKLVLIAPLGLKAKGVPIEDVFMLSLQAVPAKLFAVPPTDEPTPGQIARQMQDRKTLALLAWNPFLHNPRLATWLHRVQSPVQLLWGERDQFLPHQHAQAWLHALRRATLHVLNDAGHLPHHEQPEAAVRVIEAFLQE